MFAWIAQNLGTILISAVLLVIVIAVVRYLIRQKKQGKVPAARAARTAQMRAAATISNNRGSASCIKQRLKSTA